MRRCDGVVNVSFPRSVLCPPRLQQKEGGLSATATLIVRTNSLGPVVTARVLGSDNNDNVVNANNKVILSASAQSTASDEGLQWKWSVESGTTSHSARELCPHRQ